ncbi:MAG: hypothetical protein Q7S36_00135 [Candidatus Liptonbacteria bacterium]|nr:hypothetical protein [Candidatus Liptonbacteria bacterium]
MSTGFNFLKDSDKKESGFFNGELVFWNGEKDWEIISIPEGEGVLFEIAKFKENKYGQMVYAREIVDLNEISRQNPNPVRFS